MTLNPFRKPDPSVSSSRVFYEQASGVKAGLMDLYRAVAAEIDIKPWALRALAIVESDEKPFTPNGNPVIRFEPTYWAKRRIASAAALEFDKAVNARDLDARYTQFMAMAAVQEDAAICSHSWTMFQIMGAHHQACLCAHPTQFVRTASTLEGQFSLVKHFILSNPPLLSALRKQDAEQVGLHYNGAGFRRNKYDVRWAAAARAGGEGVWNV